MSSGRSDDDGPIVPWPPRGSRKRTTLRGLVAPARPENEADPHGRVTLDFIGPPLSLPGEAEGSAPLGDPPAEPAPDPAGADSPIEHDGWTRDRLRRGSGVHPAVPPSTRPPPISADPRALPRDEGGAIDLVDRSRPTPHDKDLAAEMADRYALGDFTGALRAAELLIGQDPAHPDAHRYAENSRERLVQLYSSRLGSMARVPRVAVADREVRWLGIDHKAGFLLSRVDGLHTLEEIVDMSGMPRLSALKMLAELLEAGAITL